MQVAWLAILAVALAACHAALPLGAAPPDGAAPADVPLQLDLVHGIDDARDAVGPGLDLPLPAEAALPFEAGPLDGPLADTPPVTTVDGTTGPLCGNGKPAFTAYSDPKMILCADFTGVTYCNAAPLCPAGWAICDSVQYLARGGTVEKPGANAWITGCVKKDNAVFPPDPNPCAATCVSANDPSPPSAIWNCDTNAGGSVTSQYLGIISVDTCHRIGNKQPTTAAFWIAFAWDAKAQGAVCCAP